MYDNKVHSVPDRIVSVRQPFLRLIVRGKAGKPVEFGAKLDISVVAGWTRLEYCFFDAYFWPKREKVVLFGIRQAVPPYVIEEIDDN